jgi:cell division GTPase FtsZ
MIKNRYAIIDFDNKELLNIKENENKTNDLILKYCINLLDEIVYSETKCIRKNFSYEHINYILNNSERSILASSINKDKETMESLMTDMVDALLSQGIISNIKGIIVSLKVNSNYLLSDITEAMHKIYDIAGEYVEIILGTDFDDSFDMDTFHITVIFSYSY